MPSIGNIILGLLGIAGGVYMMKEAYYLNHHVYFLSWAERKWGPGSGTLAYRFIGLALTIFAVFVITGWVDLVGSSGLSTGTDQDRPAAQNPVTVPTGPSIAP